MKDNHMKRLVNILLLFLLLFTAICLLLFYLTGGMEPGVLIGCVFGATIGELSVMGMIQKTKKKNESEDGKNDTKSN